MNAPQHIRLPDVQARADTRNLPIEAVGVKGLRYPVTVLSGGTSMATVAEFTLTVAGKATVKGTHMSRFVELFERQTARISSVLTITAQLTDSRQGVQLSERRSPKC